MTKNKSISAKSGGMIITYDDNKSSYVKYEPKKDYINSIQINGKRKYQPIEFQLNKTQLRLYNEAVYGFKAYSNEVIMEMRPQHIKRIKEIHLKAKDVINSYKIELANLNMDNFLSKMFPNSKLAKTMVQTKGIEPDIKISLSLKDLKVSTENLAKRLVQYRVLPENFFNLV
jgi:hypothetical protein